MTAKDLKQWLTDANSPASATFAVAWVAAETPHAESLAKEWIASKIEITAQTGWATVSSLVSVKPDSELDIKELKRLLNLIEKTIHQQPNLVRSAMNNFVIALGTYVKDLTHLAIKTGQTIGPVTIDKGDTACKVPFSPTTFTKPKSAAPSGKSALPLAANRSHLCALSTTYFSNCTIPPTPPSPS